MEVLSFDMSSEAYHTCRLVEQLVCVGGGSQLMAAMEQAAPAWNRSYRRQDIDQRKMRLILMAPCTPKRPADRRKITGLLHAWLAAIREQHPKFRVFKDSRGIFKLNYY